jgi:hypothetical protein
LTGNQEAATTTSATGSSCCAYGDTTTGAPPGPYYRCSCDSIDCKTVIADGQGVAVASCSIGSIPACGGEVTGGYTQVSSCDTVVAGSSGSSSGG